MFRHAGKRSDRCLCDSAARSNAVELEPGGVRNLTPRLQERESGLRDFYLLTGGTTRLPRAAGWLTPGRRFAAFSGLERPN
jgi:hypothetical protein